MKCPVCTAENKETALMCEYCGERFDKKADVSNDTNENVGSKICPACKKGNKDSALMCEYCGEKFNKELKQKSSKTNYYKESTGPKECSVCGMGNKDSAKMCEFCGESFIKVAKVKEIPKEEVKSNYYMESTGPKECASCGMGNKESAKICEFCGEFFIKVEKKETPKVEDKIDKIKISTGPKKCPDCGIGNKESAKMCEFCGESFGDNVKVVEISKEVPKEESTTVILENIGTKNCFACGEENKESAKMCEYCGVSFINVVKIEKIKEAPKEEVKTKFFEESTGPKKCLACEIGNKESAKMCEFCGESFGDNVKVVEIKEEPKKEIKVEIVEEITGTKDCLACGKENKASAKMCEYCGEDFDKKAKQTAKEVSKEVKSNYYEESTGPKECSVCGKGNKEEAKMCEFCGEKFENSEIIIEEDYTILSTLIGTILFATFAMALILTYV